MATYYIENTCGNKTSRKCENPNGNKEISSS